MAPRAPHLITSWNISLPAPFAARVAEFLRDPLTGRERYGERARITVQLWEAYMANLDAPTISTQLVIVPLPQTDHIRFQVDNKTLSYDELREAVRTATKTPAPGALS